MWKAPTEKNMQMQGVERTLTNNRALAAFQGVHDANNAPEKPSPGREAEKAFKTDPPAVPVVSNDNAPITDYTQKQQFGPNPQSPSNQPATAVSLPPPLAMPASALPPKAGFAPLPTMNLKKPALALGLTGSLPAMPAPGKPGLPAIGGLPAVAPNKAGPTGQSRAFGDTSTIRNYYDYYCSPSSFY